MSPAPPSVVALGGGHGLSATLHALTRVTPHLHAVVTVGDDGGSSGRLRRERGALPPGDLRMALAALAAPEGEGAAWAATLQHRLGPSGTGGADPLAGHAVGNLLIHALHEETGDVVAALDRVAALVGARGRVLPVAEVPLVVVGTVRGPADRVREVRGQVGVARARGTVDSVRVEPPDAPVPRAVVDALRDADAVVLGPGSWFSSVLPHVLVPAVRRELDRPGLRVVVVLNLAPQEGETDDFTPAGHVDVLAAHAPGLRVDVVVADRGDGGPDLAAAAERVGAACLLRDVARGDGSPRHDRDRLAAALAEAVGRGGAGSDARRGGAPAPPDTPPAVAGDSGGRARTGAAGQAQEVVRAWP